MTSVAADTPDRIAAQASNSSNCGRKNGTVYTPPECNSLKQRNRYDSHNRQYESLPLGQFGMGHDITARLLPRTLLRFGPGAVPRK